MDIVKSQMKHSPTLADLMARAQLPQTAPDHVESWRKPTDRRCVHHLFRTPLDRKPFTSANIRSDLIPWGYYCAKGETFHSNVVVRITKVYPFSFAQCNNFIFSGKGGCGSPSSWLCIISLSSSACGCDHIR
jgi:hypothetical protein